MGIFSFLFAHGKEQLDRLSPAIDLKRFSVDNSALNEPVSPHDRFHDYLERTDVLQLPEDGIEIGVKEGVLDYAFITIESFKGNFFLDGTEVKLSQQHFQEDIESIFGESYWTDNSDGEKIMFYEYRNGLAELQFEFSDSIHLSHITFMNNGVLSTGEQRSYYGVNKPWPPEEE